MGALGWGRIYSGHVGLVWEAWQQGRERLLTRPLVHMVALELEL